MQIIVVSSLQREIDSVQRQFDSEKRTFDNYMKQAQNSQKKLDDFTKKMNEKRKKTDQLQKDFNKALAEELNIPLLGQIPLVQSIREGGDAGTPIVLQVGHPAAEAFSKIARRLEDR